MYRKRGIIKTLNSIMFLLIRSWNVRYDPPNIPLNSIMFLLILIRSWGSFLFFDFFKFHYVSINSSIYIMDIVTMLTLNSIMFLLIPEGHLNCFNWKAHFKFHYVSINSHWRLMMSIKYVTLNSIMFLLIPVPKPTAYLLHEIPLFCRPVIV